MIEELCRRSDHTFDLKAGTLYPLLHGLEERGLVISWVEGTEGNRPRKYYHLTEGWGYDAADPGRTALGLCLGAVCLLGACFCDYTTLCRHGKAVYTGMLLLSLGSLMLSPNVNNASYYTRYLTELYPLVYALWLCAWRGWGWSGLAASLLGGVPPVLAVTRST